MEGVSVVMGAYNGEKYVEEQLRSILGQTAPPIEIIVSDDASVDGTVEIVRHVAADSPIPIRVHSNSEQLGFAENFLRACELAKGRYIAFSDQDDRWSSHKLETQLEALSRHSAVLCSHRVNRMDAQGNVIGELGASHGHPVLITPHHADPWGNFYGFTMLFERSLLLKIPRGARGMDPHTQGAAPSHDRWAWFLASTFGVMVLLDEVLANYRQHDNQLYGALKPRSIREQVATKLADGEQQTRTLASVARHRAELLDRLGADDPELWTEGARRWRTLESHLLKSAALHGRSQPHRRLGRLVANVASGVYGSGEERLGRERLKQDVVMVIAHILYRKQARAE